MKLAEQEVITEPGVDLFAELNRLLRILQIEACQNWIRIKALRGIEEPGIDRGNTLIQFWQAGGAGLNDRWIGRYNDRIKI